MSYPLWQSVQVYLVFSDKLISVQQGIPAKWLDPLNGTVSHQKVQKYFHIFINYKK